MMWISSRIQVGALLCLLANCSLGEAQASDQNPILYGGNNTNGCDEAVCFRVLLFRSQVANFRLASSDIRSEHRANQAIVHLSSQYSGRESSLSRPSVLSLQRVLFRPTI